MLLLSSASPYLSPLNTTVADAAVVFNGERMPKRQKNNLKESVKLLFSVSLCIVSLSVSDSDSITHNIHLILTRHSACSAFPLEKGQN